MIVCDRFDLFGLVIFLTLFKQISWIFRIPTEKMYKYTKFTIFAFWNNCKSFHCQKSVISYNVLIAFSWLCSILLELDTGELRKISLHEWEKQRKIIGLMKNNKHWNSGILRREVSKMARHYQHLPFRDKKLLTRIILLVIIYSLAA